MTTTEQRARALGASSISFTATGIRASGFPTRHHLDAFMKELQALGYCFIGEYGREYSVTYIAPRAALQNAEIIRLEERRG